MPMWFTSLSTRYQSWADNYLKPDDAKVVDRMSRAQSGQCSGTASFWSRRMSCARQGKIDARTGRIRKAVDKVVEVVVSPDTASGQEKRGDTYLARENVFYRMLLILGLSSYERITGDTRIGLFVGAGIRLAKRT